MEKKYQVAGVNSSNDRDDRHILMWDFDAEPTKEQINQLKDIANKYSLELLIIQTPRGYHIVDVHLFEIDELDQIQQELKLAWPSDYPTIKEVIEEDEEREAEFLGNTLRIIKPVPKVFTTYKGVGKIREVSKGHLDLYRKMFNSQFPTHGTRIDTSISITGYMKTNGED